MANNFTTTVATGDPTDIDIVDRAAEPKRTRTEEGTVEERTMHELIAADRYQGSKDAADTVPWGMKIARTKPGDTLGGT
jgi:hypothetical protein